MKSILLSVQPEWVDRICTVIGERNGLPVYEKQDEVRKSRPNVSVPFKVYIYETKGRTDTPWVDEDGHTIYKGRGQVIGHFICDRMTYIAARVDDHGEKHLENTAFLRTCLTNLELFNSLYREGGRCSGWAWHISALKIYEKPRALSEFKRPCPVSDCQECSFALWQTNTFISESRIVGCTQKIKAPQSWCYVMEEGT